MTADLKAAGLRDIFGNLAKAIDRGRLALGCVLVLDLSDLSRNVLVHPKQWRFHPTALKHKAAGSRSRSGLTALQRISSSHTNPEQRGWCMPSPKLLARVVREGAGSTTGKVTTGFLEASAKAFGAHLLRNHHHLLATEDADACGHEAPYRVAGDGSAVQPELYTCRSTGTYCA